VQCSAIHAGRCDFARFFPPLIILTYFTFGYILRPAEFLQNSLPNFSK
jgi:hypothetical protein